MEWFKEKDINGFTYISSKFILLVAFIIVLTLAVISLNYSKFSGKVYYYTECGTDLRTSQCENVYFNSNLCLNNIIQNQNLSYGKELCGIQFMTPGQKIGEQPPWLVRNFSMVGSLIVAFALLINTLIYNKGFFKFLLSKLKEVKDE